MNNPLGFAEKPFVLTSGNPLTLEAESIANTARAAVPPQMVLVDGVQAFLGVHRDVSLYAISHLLPAPARRSGGTMAHTLEDFITLTRRFETEKSTVIYANFTSSKITAVFNDHGPDGPGWGDHVVNFYLHASPELEDWLKLEKWQDQVAFAEFLQLHAHEVREPAAADVLEMVLNFQAVETGRVVARQNLRNGAVKLQYERDCETVSVDLPASFSLALPLYQFAPPVALQALLRYRIRDGKPIFALVFTDLAKAQEAAKEAILSALRTAFPEIPVVRGARLAD